MPIPQETIDQIRDRTDIVDVVGARVDLKRAGVNFKGLCPFHDEKTPSFIVSPERQTFHCFGCETGGNIFTFLMEIEGVTFPEAVRTLGRACGVEVEDRRMASEDRSRNDAFYEANRFAARFYHRALVASPEGETARKYLIDRGIPQSAWTRFGIGFASESWDNFWSAARDARINRQVLTNLKLVVAREKGSGYYDYFRSRVIFPIISPEGRVVAFGGRALGKGVEPKYLNSTESPIFSKRRTFYGLDRARDAIRKKREVILVEGYTDLISLHLVGFENVVATCGTALSPDHAVALRRITGRVLFLPDGDSAGETAALSSGALLMAVGLDVRIGRLAPGMDPDTAARTLPGKEMAELVDGAMDYFANLDYIIKHRKFTAREREGLVRRISDSLSLTQDPLRYDVITKEVARVLEIDAASLRRRGAEKNISSKEAAPAAHSSRLLVERLVLRLVLEGTPASLEALEALDVEDFSDSSMRELYKLLDSARESRIDLRGKDFQREAEEAGLEGLAAEVSLISIPPGNVDTLLRDTIRRIKKLKIRDELAVLRNRLEELPPESDEAVAVAEYYQKLAQALTEL